MAVEEETLHNLGKAVWTAVIKLLTEFENAPNAVQDEILKKTYNIVNNASCQLSAEVSKREHPAHFVKK